MRASVLLALSILVWAGGSRAESRDMTAGALQLMCGLDPRSKARNDLGCAAFLDGFVRGYTRARGCPAKEYEPVRQRLLERAPAAVGNRLSDEVLGEIVSSIHPCRGA